MNEEAALDDVVVIALGSSLAGDFGTRQALLDAAVSAFPNVGMVVRKVSRWWRSEAWPDPAEPGYLNGVALIDTDLDPHGCLAALLDLERRFGRERAQQNAPRTLDLDLIAHGRSLIDTPSLQVPHPRACDRFFVMGPLAEIAPDWRDPVTRHTARHLADICRIGLDAEPL